MRFVQANIFLYFFLLVLGIGGFFFALASPTIEGFRAFIAFAAAGGFGVTLYIYHAKKSEIGLVCPTGSDCNAVINSRYSNFLGIPLEYLGMVYYALTFIIYIALVFSPNLFPTTFLSGLIMLSTAAFLFSLYLLFVQAFILGQWCIWCLLSATLSIIIFIISLGSVDFAVALLGEMQKFIGAVHSIGFALGIGAVTTTLFLFSRFLGDRDIDERELQTLKWVLELTWVGLALALVGQFVTFVIYPEILALSGIFVAQTVALFVALLSGAVLMIIFAPLLAVIPFGGGIEGGTRGGTRSPLQSLRRPLFITGGVVISSWFFAFAMNYFSEYALASLLTAYGILLVVTIAAALLWEKSFSR